nr:unnamed protein product [Callosobruchus chinensis]
MVRPFATICIPEADAKRSKGHEAIAENITSPRPCKANQEQTSSHERSSNEGYLPVTVSVQQWTIYKACQHSESRVHAQHDGSLGGTQAQMTERAPKN